MDTTAANKQVARDAAEVLGLITREMALVEDEFTRQASSGVTIVEELGSYVRRSGGKRVRPALLILTNYSCGGRGDAESVIRLATVMEMLHTATLVHDNIIDNAEIRRDRPSVNARFGNQAAVLLGDWLYMSAFETSLRERSLEILDILTRLTRKMTEGELIQLTTLKSVDIDEDAYFEILKRKTAYLFSGCCEIGAILAGATEGIQMAMANFGLDLGIAFQLADDILDLTAEETELGKAAGRDLLEGKMTLPLIKLAATEPGAKAVLNESMAAGEWREGARDVILDKLWKNDCLTSSKQVAVDHAERAKKNLEVLPQTEYRSALATIADFVVARTR